MKVEKVWKASGLDCVVVMQDWGHRCGYVGVGQTHPLYGVECSDHCPALERAMKKALDGPIGKRGIIPLLCSGGVSARMDVVFDVHGGVTFSGNGEGTYPILLADTWWIGFDCAHSGDGAAPGFEDVSGLRSGIHRSLEYCVAECESLAAQLQQVELTTIE